MRSSACVACVRPTGITNRRAFFQRGQALLDRLGGAAQAHVAALMLDLDHFKAVNDAHGHNAGDAVLKRFASRVAELLGINDLFGRLGGEEFAIITTDQPTAEDVIGLAEAIRKRIADTPFDLGGTRIPLTVSIGIAHLDPSISDLDALLSAADAHLYLAKRQQRNCVHHPGLAAASPVPSGHSHIRRRRKPSPETRGEALG